MSSSPSPRTPLPRAAGDPLDPLDADADAEARRASLPLRTTLEICAYLHNLQNLDLLSRGWYALRASCEIDGAPCVAREVVVVALNLATRAECVAETDDLDWRLDGGDDDERERERERERFRGGRGGGASDKYKTGRDDDDDEPDEDEPSSSSSSSSSRAATSYTYTTRAFKVMYACEAFPVEHLVRFTASVPSTVDPASVAATIRFQLLHLPLKDDTGDNKRGGGYEPPPTRRRLFESASAVVATQEITIASDALTKSGGAHEYFPVHFDALHLTLCDVTIHACAVGVETREDDDAEDEERGTMTKKKKKKTKSRGFGLGCGAGCGGGASDAKAPRRAPKRAGASTGPTGRAHAVAAALAATSDASLPPPYRGTWLGDALVRGESVAEKLAVLYARCTAPLIAAAYSAAAAAARAKSASGGLALGGDDGGGSAFDAVAGAAVADPREWATEVARACDGDFERCGAALSDATAAAAAAADERWRAFVSAVEEGGAGRGLGGAWILAPLRAAWEEAREAEWAPWTVRSRAAAPARELAALEGGGGGGGGGGSGGRNAKKAEASRSPVVTKLSSLSSLADAADDDDDAITAMASARAAAIEVGRRRREMKSRGGAFVVDGAARLFDSALHVKPETVTMISTEESIAIPPPPSPPRSSSDRVLTPRESSNLDVHLTPARASADPVPGGAALNRRRSLSSRRCEPTDDPEVARAIARALSMSKSNMGEHMVVLVHGFAGSLQDLRLVRAHLRRVLFSRRLVAPNAHTHVSVVNHEKTMESIATMGARLAEEVSQVMAELEAGELTPRGGGRTPRSAAAAAAEAAGRGAAPPRLSFVGHSIGALIVRASLTHPSMSPFLTRLNTFLSISGPHLGYLGGVAPSAGFSVFETGLKVLRAIKGKRAESLREITFADAKKREDCYLYELAHEKRGLGLFKHVMLVSSPQDKYVPHHSARIQPPPEEGGEGGGGGGGKKRSNKATTREMARALLTPVLSKATGGGDTPGGDDDDDKITTLTRVDVHFAPPAKRTLNHVIGRKAHIDFLETDEYVKFLLWSHRDKFA